MTDAAYQFLACAAISLAFWDAARRHIGKRHSDDEIASLRKSMDALKQRNDAQVTNLIKEVRDLLDAQQTKMAGAVAAGSRHVAGIRGVTK